MTINKFLVKVLRIFVHHHGTLHNQTIDKFCARSNFVTLKVMEDNEFHMWGIWG
jgi:hypothetical protein